jgi:hypothetical protein
MTAQDVHGFSDLAVYIGQLESDHDVSYPEPQPGDGVA